MKWDFVNENYKIKLVEEGVFYILVAEGVQLTEQIAKSLYQYYSEQTDENYGTILEFEGEKFEPTKQAKLFIAKGDIPKNFKARAVIYTTLAVRIETNNFIHHLKPQTPTLLVKDLEEGIEFIQQHL